MSRSTIREAFPRLRTSQFYLTSEPTTSYNCIAWAAGDQGRWWWPRMYFWPAGIPASDRVESFVAAYATLGYSPCDSGTREDGFEKIALFARDDGRVTHAARQLENGRWTSKLGNEEDIEHLLFALEGEAYGSVVQFLRRPRSSH